MKIIGLVGGIAMGKSTVAKILESFGVPVIYVDQLSREAVVPGSDGLREIKENFGDSFILPDGNLDRSKMAETIFQDESKKSALEQILHPKINKIFNDKLRDYSDVPFVVVENAILLSTEQIHQVDGILLINVWRDTQIERLKERNGLTHEKALAVIDSQTTIEQKLATIHTHHLPVWIIDTGCDRSELDYRVRTAWNHATEIFCDDD